MNPFNNSDNEGAFWQNWDVPGRLNKLVEQHVIIDPTKIE